eukprot:NODE_31_length_32452_cov_0.352672.p18 type:complete len:196 gc:universal NODE_31_length_32452_cov_0.352672:28318-27731(-)
MISNNNYGKVTTEWDDALVQHGIIKRQEEPEEVEEVYEDPFDKLNKDEIDLLLEESGDQEEQILQKLRFERLKDMERMKNIKYGSVFQISQTEYKEHVTVASRKDIVVVLLFDGSEESQVLSRFMDRAAADFGNVKFCAIPGKTAIPNYPTKNIPTILIYYNELPISQTIKNIPGLKEAKYEAFVSYLKPILILG